MVLTRNGKSTQANRQFRTNGSMRLNVFSWNDGFYNVELQQWDGFNWQRKGKTKCVTEAEFEEMKKNNQYPICQGE